MLHDADGARIQQRRVCSADGKEVDWDHIVKGFEISKGRYVTVTREELEKFAPQATRQVEIEDFVELSEIDPIYYDATYYLAPDKGAQKAYALLLTALRKTARVGIGRMVLRTRQYLCAIRPLGKALAISTMQYEDEIVPVTDLDGLPGAGEKPADKQLQLAEQLVGQLAGKFEPSKYHDTYREQVVELLEKKAAGEEVVTPEAPQRPGQVIDLMEALRRSLESAPGRGGTEAKAPEEKGRRRGNGRARGERRHKAAPEQRSAARSATRRASARKAPARKGRKRTSA
jgi:DNA end-binding protein Ku